jgi:hypothetical protein
LQLVKVGFIHIEEAHSGQETPGSESGISAKNTRAGSQLPTLWDVDQRCARTSMICNQKLWLCHE